MVVDEEFEAFFATHYARVVSVLAIGWGDLPAAEDATQEAFARALRRWPRVRLMARPDGWVYVTATNVLRRGLRSGDHESAGGAHERPVGDSSEAIATQVTIRDAVALLPPRQRQVVVLRHLAGLSTAEVAEAMACAPGTVKSTLSQALRALRVELEDDDES